MRTLIFAAIAATSGICSADALPFWGEGSPQTNRETAVSHVVTLTSFSSLEWFESVFALQEFNSTRLGLMLFVK